MIKKNIEDYDYNELVEYCTGQAIMSLGRGESMKQIIGFTAHMFNHWTWRLAEQKNEKLKRKKSVR